MLLVEQLFMILGFLTDGHSGERDLFTAFKESGGRRLQRHFKDPCSALTLHSVHRYCYDLVLSRSHLPLSDTRHHSFVVPKKRGMKRLKLWRDSHLARTFVTVHIKILTTSTSEGYNTPAHLLGAMGVKM